jgi:O-succinylbenzoic acid--CoA ligase
VTRSLRAAAADRFAEALHSALDGSGPAVFAGEDPGDLPDVVPQRVALVVQSSGSTGRPKRVALSADALLASAAASASAVGSGQWLLALPTTYIAGVNVLVRSIAADSRPIVMEPEHFTAERFTIAARELTEKHLYTSLVPTQLTRLLRSDDATEQLRRFDAVLLGGQAAPLSLLEEAERAGVRVVRTYGSSETSGGCVYDGVGIGTTDIRVRDGEVRLAGPVLAEGYLRDPERSEAAFLVEDGIRWYRTGDSGVLEDGRLRVTGRLDDLIISGGVKVALGEVEALVRSQPGLADAVVVPVRQEEWGEVPLVVTTGEVDRDELRAVVADRLGAAAAPARVERVDAIPLLASGKPDRLGIRKEFDR